MARYYEENALIEFVKQYTPTINGETTMECVERAIREAPTADVVPKSEVEKFAEEIKLEFYREFDEIIPSIMADKIDELYEVIFMKEDLMQSINPIQEAIEQKKKENKGVALGVLNELLDEKDAEIKRLEYTLTGIMHSVDKWLEGEELKQDEVNRAITMREKTLRIVEQYQEKLEDYKDCWYKIHDSYNADCRESYNIGRQEVAREIFEEIDNKLHDMAVEYHNAGHPEYFAVCEVIHHKVIRPVEKKYTKSEDT